MEEKEKKKGEDFIQKKEKEISEKEKNKSSDNKTLRNIFIGLGMFVALFVCIVLFVYSMNHFEYKGINFNVIKDTGGLTFYHLEEGYNLRKDPRKLDKIPFEGEINFAPINKLVYNSTRFECEGDGVIAAANLGLILHAIAGIDLVKDQNATCDSQGRYMFVNIKPGNETRIIQNGPSCYEFEVNNCEILDVTEKFIVEILSKINEIKEN